ncbi:hypothetical protein ACFSQ3_10355 [Sphingobacterium corticis]|uniref:DUF4229 domain-containing protein n=1 Tax=Sphingobacterium corticis TaxID=1812823 RepID=A0ABW5NJQ4_9SPHI
MRWIFWFFVVNIVSFFSLMKGLIGDGNMFVGAFIAFAAWALFLRAIFLSLEKKRKMKNRDQMIDEYLRQQLRK